jgi:hypothetical protein
MLREEEAAVRRYGGRSGAGEEGSRDGSHVHRSRDRMTHFWVMSRSPKHNFDQMHVFPKSIYDLLIFGLNTLEVIDIQNLKKYYCIKKGFV